MQSPPPSSSAPGSRRLLVIGWDAADWRIIDPLLQQGYLQNLAGLIRRGTRSDLATLHPVLSPTLWTSIATGFRPFEHGITGFIEPDPSGKGSRPISVKARRKKAFWNIAHQQGLTSTVACWWPSHPAEPIRGRMISNLFLHVPPTRPDGTRPLEPQGAVHPPEAMAEHANLRIGIDNLPGEALLKFVPKAREIDQEKDKRLASLAKIYCDATNAANAAILAMERTPWDVAAVYFDATDHIGHAFMKYHPPRLDWVKEEDFNRYRDVVSVMYRYVDWLTGRILALAGPDTNIVLLSDHGFSSGGDRPAALPVDPVGPAAEHRDVGILVTAGPAFAPGATAAGANLLDIAPTLLATLGLPAGADMPGRVLDELLVEQAPARIPSWEPVGGEDGSHPKDAVEHPLDAAAALGQLVALGYIEAPDGDPSKAAQTAGMELRLHEASSLMSAGRHAEAAEKLAGMLAETPDDLRYWSRLVDCLLALGLWREGLAALDETVRRRDARAAKARAWLAEHGKDTLPEGATEDQKRAHARRLQRQLADAQPNPLAEPLMRASLLLAGKRNAAARELLATLPDVPAVPAASELRRLAGLRLQLGLDAQALPLLEALKRVDPEHPDLLALLARQARRQRKPRTALELAERSLVLSPRQPALRLLCAALKERQGDPLGAMKDYQEVLRLNPNSGAALLGLARLADAGLGAPGDAELLRARAAELAAANRAAARGRGRDFRGKLSGLARLESRSATAGGVKLPEGIAVHAPLGDRVLVVTGLPRSGTSLVMQMLAAGGLPIVQDGVRAPDENNPKGFLEFEPVKALARDAGWFGEAAGRGIKVVLPLVRFLPASVPVKFAFVERPVDEVLRSQAKMRERHGQAPLEPGREAPLRRRYEAATKAMRKRLEGDPAEGIVIEYRAILADPAAAARALNALVGGGLDETAMAAVADPALHRERA